MICVLILISVGLLIEAIIEKQKPFNPLLVLNIIALVILEASRYINFNF